PAAQGAAAPAGGGPSKHNDSLFDSILTSALGADAERARLGDSGAGDARPSAGRGRGADDSAGDIAAASPELAAGAAEPPPVSVDEASSPAGTGGDPGEGPGARALDVGAWVVGSYGASQVRSTEDWRSTVRPCPGSWRVGLWKSLR